MAEVIRDLRLGGDPQRISYGRAAGDGYKYVLKHGMGPGVLPEDVGIIRECDMDNGLTFVWLDRVLSEDECSYYDIPLETELRRYEAMCE